VKNMRAKLTQCKPSREIRLAVFVLLLTASILLGCRNPFNQSGGDEPAMGTFLLTIGGISRTISPQWPGTANVRFSLLFTSPVHDDILVPAWSQGISVSLFPGTWALVVAVYPITGNTDHPIATGTLSPINVTPGGTVGGTITLNPILDADAPRGTFTWDIAIPPDTTVTDTHLLITPIGGGGAIHDAFVGTSSSYPTPLTLPPGTYNVVFTLAVDDRENAVMREVLYIYSNMTSHFAETLGNLHFPETLLSIILDAWDKYNDVNSEGDIPGSIRAYLEYWGLRTGHFGLLDIHGLGVMDGFADADFPTLLNWFDTLSRTGPGPRPYDLPSLARLVDAALVGVGMLGDPVSPVPPPAPSNRLAAQDHILLLVVNNWDVPGFVVFNWAAVNDPVSVTVGGYTFPIAFATAVYDHRVTFIPNGGGGSQDHILAYTGQIAMLPGAPGARNGFIFTGWNTQANGGGRQHLGGSPFTVTSDMILYAAWVLIPVIGGTPELPAAITIILDSGDGSGGQIALTSVPGGTEIILPPLPGTFTNPGSYFTGWRVGGGGGLLPVGSTFTVTGPGPLVLVAQWEAGEMPVIHRVTIEPNADGVGAPIVMYVPHGATITLPGGGFVREWWDLEPYWYTQATGGTSHAFGGPLPFPVNSDVTLFARWSRPRYTVRFDPTGGPGNALPNVYVYRGETTPPLPVLTRTGYAFVGWVTEVDGVRVYLGQTPFLVTGDTDLFSNWQPGDPPVFTVTFKPNGGAQDPVVLSEVVGGFAMVLPPGKFTRADYAFIGWYRDSPGGPVLPGLSLLHVNSDITLYAAWRPAPAGSAPPSTFTVTFKPNGGVEEEFSLMPVPQGTLITLPGAVFTMPGNYFLSGWSRNVVAPNTGTAQYSIIPVPGTFTVTGNETLHAVWHFATVTSISVTPSTADMERGRTATPFTATVGGLGSPPQTFIWEFGSPVLPGTSIDRDTGEITIAANEALGPIIVRATSALDGNWSYSVYVTVTAPPAISIDITGLDLITRGDSFSFTAVVNGEVGEPLQDVTWEVFADGAELHYDTGFGNNGNNLEVSPDQMPGTLRVRATSVATPAVYRDFELTVFMPTITSMVISPPAPRAYRDGALQLSVAIAGLGLPSQAVTWHIVSSGHLTGTAISAAGLLTVPGAESREYVTIEARSVLPVGHTATVNVAFDGEVQVGEWRIVRTGVDHVMAITWKNALYTWGANARGQLGIGTTVNENRPQRVMPGTYDWIDVSGGWGHTIALRADRTIWIWGEITPGDGGTAIDGLRYGTTPMQLGSYDDWIHVAAGHSQSFAIREGGALYAWGFNGYNRLGLPNVTDHPNTPTRVGELTGWRSVSTRNHTMAIREVNPGEFRLYGWGNNASSRVLGNGTAGVVASPTLVQDSHEWRAVSTGNEFTLAIRHDDTMWIWGAGAGANATATEVPGNRRWESVTLNATAYALAIERNDNPNVRGGRLWSWGSNAQGQVGNGSVGGTVAIGTPHQMTHVIHPVTGDVVPVAGDFGDRWISSAGGGPFGLAVRSDGSLWAWGANTNGQLGDGTITDRSTPVQVNRQP